MRLSCISLFSMGPKLDNFCEKKFTFGSSFLPHSKILVALLIAFTATEGFCKRLYWQHPKRTKKRYWPHVSLFFRHEYEIFKTAKLHSRTISVFMSKSLVYFSAPPHFRLVPLPFVCCSDGTGFTPYNLQKT